MHHLDRSDRSSVSLVRPLDVISARLRHDRESGQAMVEFALILIPLLLLVVGIIQFGIGLNYWLDLNRMSNQGARFAVVNAWPTCPRTADNDAVAPHSGSDGCTQTLQEYIAGQLPSSRCPTVTISFPATGGTKVVGDPVKVELKSPFTFRAIMKLGTLTLAARTTMRIEQDAVRYTSGSYKPAGCP
jgi:Flp pilus assembly protein TadG